MLEMNSVIETSRIRMRRFTLSDFDNLFKLDSDPEVMKYISVGKTMTVEEIKALLSKIVAKYETWKNLGIWAAELKATNEFIGWFALKELPGTKDIEAGYRLLRKFWGQGLATEGGAAVIQYGLNTIGLDQIVAITNPQNRASKRVLEKIGLTFSGDRDYQSNPEANKQIVSWYKITNPKSYLDLQTKQAYSANALNYSQDWLNQPEPSDMYELLMKYFIPEGSTADIGCGNGRDVNWLAKQGFKVTGYDSSLELLNEARGLFSNIQFHQANLPLLSEIDQRFYNIICETVIMHLPVNFILPSIERLINLLNPKGVLYLSWRVTEGSDQRHSDGRLYSAFGPDLILNCFDKKSILHFEDRISASSGRRVCRLVYKTSSDKVKDEGIPQ